MLKHLVHSHHGKLHTFDDFYRTDSKSIKLRRTTNECISINTPSPSLTAPYSPSNNSYTFYNVFSDFKSTTTPNVVIEEEEDDIEHHHNEIISQQESNLSTPLFYLEDDHHHHQSQTSSPSSSTSPHWPSLIFNRFRHNHHGVIKQNSVNENQMMSTKLRKNDLTDNSLISKHRFLKHSQTMNHSNNLIDKKCLNDDFPELSLPPTNNNNPVKKHRSFVSLFHHFHHQNNSTETLNIENNDNIKKKVHKQKTFPSSSDKNYPVIKSPSTPILPKLTHLFHRHHFQSEQHKYRVGNLKARLHHRRHSPPLTNTAPKFQCQVSNELIKQLEEEDYIHSQPSVKPVVMKRVHTWHNTFDLRPIDQNYLLKNQRTNHSSDDDQAFEKFLQEHRTPIAIKYEEKSPLKQRKNRNSLKDFICDSSSEEEHPLEFYPKINRLIKNDSTWRNTNDDYISNESSSEESDCQLSSRKTKDIKISINFLESLSNYVPIEDKHSDAKEYFTRSGFKNKKKRQELAEKLFTIFDQDVFSSKLSDKVTIIWSARLTATAGHCTTRRSSSTATITLSYKVCDSPERCRDTLLHEMCHAAVSLIDGIMNEGHGPLWRKWTHRAERCYPYLPAISVKHTYDVTYKYVYRCIQCQYEVYRHSKSIDIKTDGCGKCLGKFELLLNKKINEEQTSKKTLTRYNLFIKEHFQIMKQAQPHLSTPQLMKHLSQEYKKKTQQDQIDLPDLEQLKI